MTNLTIILIEYTFLGQELQFCEKTDTDSLSRYIKNIFNRKIYYKNNIYQLLSAKSTIIRFYYNLDNNLLSIANDLKNRTYIPSHYNRFLIKDPKERIIAASPVRDRVVQHALMNYYNKIFDRHLIFDSYACRINKGTHKAILRAFHFSKSSKYFLKMDVRKYFNSIDHSILKEMLTTLIKEKSALELFKIIIDSSDRDINRGISIGNLTSQYFANFYLSGFDHYFKEQYHVKHYIRYMDDILIFSNKNEEIKEIYNNAVNYADEKLNLLYKARSFRAGYKRRSFSGLFNKALRYFLQKKTKKKDIKQELLKQNIIEKTVFFQILKQAV